jgi:recombination protein RecA
MKSAETVRSEMNKQFGGEVVIMASELPEEVRRVPTGSLSVDVATGGGWPRGHWSEIVGMESSGKTALSFLTVAAAQRENPEHITVWVAAEEFVPSWARACGVDLNRVMLINTNVAEAAFDTALNFMENRACDLVVIDSLPALLPDEENTKDMDEPQVALQARLNAKFFRKAGYAMHRLAETDRPCTGIVINQFRSLIGGWARYGEPTTTPGGKAKNYYFFVRAEVSRVDWIKDRDRKVGQRIRVVVNKNKTAPGQRQTEFDFYFDHYSRFAPGQVDQQGELMALGIDLGVIGRKGAWYTVGEQQYQGMDAVMQGLRDRPDLAAFVTREVMSILTAGKQLVQEASVAQVVKRKRRATT